MAAAEKSHWVQVMEAGFGATLEAHGFRKVSPRLYRLEGDGIIWEQFTYRGLPDIAGSFREGSGGVIPGADEIHRAAFGEPMTIYYGGRKYLFGFLGSIDTATSLIEFFRMGESKLWSMYYSIKQSIWYTDKHYLERKTPYFGVLFGKGYWHLNGDSLEKVAGELGKLWIKYMWTNGFDRRLSLRETIQINYGEDRLGKRFFEDYATILHYLDGNRNLARRFLLHAIHCANLNEREMTKRVVERDEHLLHEDEFSDPEIFPTIESEVKGAMEAAAWEGERARKLAKVLDIAI